MSRAREWAPCAATWMIWDSPGTGWGSGWLVSVPSPSCPWLLHPQATTVRFFRRARPCPLAVLSPPSSNWATFVKIAPGASVLVLRPLPSCPKVLRPHVYRVPFLVSAPAKSRPAQMALTVLRLGMTAGGSLPPNVPFPSWPTSFDPHDMTEPVLNSAYPEVAAAAMALAPVTPGTGVGDRTGPVLGNPRALPPLEPQASTVPLASRAKAFSSPPATATAVVIPGTSTAPGYGLVFPCPSWPSTLLPQAQTVPPATASDTSLPP